MDMRLSRGILVTMQSGKKYAMNRESKDEAMKPASDNIAEDNMTNGCEQCTHKPSIILFAPQ